MFGCLAWKIKFLCRILFDFWYYLNTVVWQFASVFRVISKQDWKIEYATKSEDGNFKCCAWLSDRCFSHAIDVHTCILGSVWVHDEHTNSWYRSIWVGEMRDICRCHDGVLLATFQDVCLRETQSGGNEHILRECQNQPDEESVGKLNIWPDLLYVVH